MFCYGQRVKTVIPTEPKSELKMKDGISKQSKRSNASVTEVIRRGKNVVGKSMELKKLCQTNIREKEKRCNKKDRNASQ